MVMTNLMVSWGKNANSDADRFIAAHVVKIIDSEGGGPPVSCILLNKNGYVSTQQKIIAISITIVS